MKQNQLALSPESKIYIAGHKGMVGSAILRHLQAKGYMKIVTKDRDELDLTNQQAVRGFFKKESIDYVVIGAAKVGGIHANSRYPAEFIYQNLMIEANVIHEAYLAGIERILFLGSSCIYPKDTPQPMKEEYLLSGKLEPTNSAYAIAKIAGIGLCESYNRQYGTKYRSVMPTNLYGPNDNYDLENSHVLAALIRKFDLAKLAAVGDWKSIDNNENFYGTIPKSVRESLIAISSKRDGQNKSTVPPMCLWGSGTPKREFLHVDDLASACLLLMKLSDNQYDSICSMQISIANQLSDDKETLPNGSREKDLQFISHINIGSGQDLTIKQLAKIVMNIVNYEGEIFWDKEMPDGVQRKILDISRLKSLGWKPKIELSEGIKHAYEVYRDKMLSKT